jgi:copper(I)-binding protein
MKKNLISCSLLIFFAILTFSCNSGGTPKISVKGAKFIGKRDIAVFMLIINDGNGSDTLTGSSIKEFPSAKGEFHDVLGGKMTRVEKIEITAGEVTRLKRGSLHLMFFGLPEKRVEVTLLLQFKKSGTIEVKIPPSVTKKQLIH